MAGDFSKKTQNDNSHLQNLTSSKYVYIDGTNTTPVDLTTARRVIRITVFAKGVAFTVRNGSRPIASIATTTPEGDLEAGVYCENGVRIDGISGTGSAIVVFA